MTKVAVLDDWQGVAKSSADWSRLSERTEVVFFEEPFKNADAIAAALAGFEIIVAMRERTRFPKELIERLPKRHRYQVTDFGLRVALFVPRLWARTLRPGLATVMPDAAQNDSALRRAFERLEHAMDDWCAEVKRAA